jgi:predicted chitinase
MSDQPELTPHFACRFPHNPTGHKISRHMTAEVSLRTKNELSNDPERSNEMLESRTSGFHKAS